MSMSIHPPHSLSSTQNLKLLDGLRWATVASVLLLTTLAAVVALPGADRLASCALIALLAALAAYDLCHCRAPNAVTLPLLALAALSLPIRVWGGALDTRALVLVGVAWLTCLALWKLHVIGGGDTKLLLGLLALRPEVALVQALLGATLAGALLTLALEGDGLWRLVRAGASFDCRAIRAAYRMRGRPLVVWLAAGAALYLLPDLFI